MHCNEGLALVLPEAPELGSNITQAPLGSAADVLPTVLILLRGFSNVSVQTMSDWVLSAFSGCHPKQL